MALQDAYAAKVPSATKLNIQGFGSNSNESKTTFSFPGVMSGTSGAGVRDNFKKMFNIKKT